MIHLEKQDKATAVSLFERGLESDLPRKAKSYFHSALAVSLLREGCYEEAERELLTVPNNTPEYDVLRLHTIAGLGKTAEARRMYSDVSGRILSFRKPTAQAVDKISISWGLRPNLEPRQPTPPEIEELITVEIEMLMAA
jgi:hypothetical protein